MKHRILPFIIFILLGAMSFSMLPDAPMPPQETFPEPAPATIVTETPSLDLLADDVIATVYNALPGQCNDNPTRTASMFVIDKSRIESYRIIAMERTMMREYGLSYGDIVSIEGTGKYDGEWQIQDTMNKRFAGQHRIDFLVPDDIKTGKWTNVRIYKTQGLQPFMANNNNTLNP